MVVAREKAFRLKSSLSSPSCARYRQANVSLIYICFKWFCFCGCFIICLQPAALPSLLCQDELFWLLAMGSLLLILRSSFRNCLFSPHLHECKFQAICQYPSCQQLLWEKNNSIRLDNNLMLNCFHHLGDGVACFYLRAFFWSVKIISQL